MIFLSLFTKLYDPVMEPLEKIYLSKIRNKLIKGVKGKVLEIGIGTGANFEHYPSNIELFGIEPSKEMIEKAYAKITEFPNPIKLTQGVAEELPYPDQYFDTVISTLVLCSVHDLHASLREIARVLKPDGQVILFEHIRLDDPKWIGWVQDVLAPSWSFVCDGCQLNRDTIKVAENYFDFDQIEKYFNDVFVSAIGKKKTKD